MLGIERDATDKQVKQAYRRLALKHHPDKHPNDPDAATRFTQVYTVCGSMCVACGSRPSRERARKRMRASSRQGAGERESEAQTDSEIECKP